MAIILPPLPFAETALEPEISAETLAVHHGKHHKGYVDKTNGLIQATPLEDASLNAIVVEADSQGDTKLFNQAAQAWNHGFYWNSLSPQGGAPDDHLTGAIDKAFGSYDDLVKELVSQGEGHFGSGWVWLLGDGDALTIATTHDAGSPLTGAARPLLVIDVWEHAYYLDRKNDRKAYLTAALGLLNWGFANANFARAEAWTYPG